MSGGCFLGGRSGGFGIYWVARTLPGFRPLAITKTSKFGRVPASLAFPSLTAAAGVPSSTS